MSTALDYLKQAYFNQLEINTVDYLEIEDIGGGMTEQHIKEQFANASVDDMIEYLELQPEIAFIVKTACGYWGKTHEKPVEGIVKKLFTTVYQWGRAGVVADHHAPAFQNILEQLVNDQMEGARV